ncbi:hypothetical protein HYDPIDRAFT_111581 [Hydnomerulius pinastri MD-312]|uniref:Uncharacterized protein n=1 Tax=Hydnomerulius pinastri MD-312 TaxID=994086 RepID=A0A0C9VH16_9AGAM|nr:hypothetical protein HYDPIDRAFT_111581 [Hydnomerulius pinastri MD-312]
MAQDSASSSAEQEIIEGLDIIKDMMYIVCCTTAIVVYDYWLELKLIWAKPWSRVSTLYVLVRYLGVTLAVNEVFLGVQLHLSNQAYDACLSKPIGLC